MNGSKALQDPDNGVLIRRGRISELEYPENEELFIPPISRPTYWSQCSGPAKNCDIATVNNPAMIELQKLSTKFEADNPDIKLNWVVVEENILRQRV